ncbi:hypothetical protein DDB_G0270998 [Dictyostelium discoideum AX4]|uniref:ComC supersandwich domain-containing protein n=1 Tax=Dictyostelium discoideum TaxID=44689 RepID=Q55CS6_DICDI|nr:hypothetical protein DDB_G0270998 [Dictyostelium discoideum AX4]EAL72849.1 hypothetical protein DDB_G0270998 [Dictyostelium discoideum AX4]|eukprot:XP_646405.1 hypothetical protein DDB_G0270998 [Dictyostelium discoideum AX4]
MSITMSGFTTTTNIDSLTISISNISNKKDLVINNPFGQYYDSISAIYPELPYNQYFTNIISGSNKVTNISVTIEWFNQTKSIQFANQNLIMNPSTLKYTIEMTSYNFKSQLNTLQLVMSTLLESSKTKDICSSKQFVYGRFIKRALIDNNAKSIENVLLDSTFNPIESSYQSQSFIGIEIPNFKKSAKIDPDFSVLLSASTEDNNSICSKSNSSLSGTKIAGIVVGCTAFVAVVLISTIYIIRKKKQNSKFINNMNSNINNRKFGF